MSEFEHREEKKFKVGNFIVNPSRNLLIARENEIQIAPKVLSVLTILAKRQGETVSKDELLKVVWGEIATTDMVLSKAISDLRKVLGDTAKKKEYIKTVSKKGYTLISKVEWCESEVEAFSTNLFGNAAISNNSGLKSILAMIAIFFVFIFSVYHYNKLLVPIQSYHAPVISNITADSLEQRYPRFSPDGKKIAYFEFADDLPDKLMIRDIQSGNTNIIKTFAKFKEDGGSRGLAFSPSGHKLAVRVENAEGCDILTIDLRSMIEEKIDNCPYSSIGSIEFSSDGNSLITTAFDWSRQIVQLRLIDLKLKNISPIGNQSLKFGLLYPRVSNNGKMVASIGWDVSSTSNSIIITDIETGTNNVVYKTENILTQVLWSERDDLLFFSSVGTSNKGVWSLNLNTREKNKILNSTDYIRDIDYSRSNRTFVYSLSKHQYIINLFKETESEMFKPLDLDLPTKNNIIPSISNNGEKLAYVSKNSKENRVVVYTLANKFGEVVYTAEGGRVTDINWSHDSTTLLVTQVTDKKSEIVQIDLASKSISILDSEHSASTGRWDYLNRDKYWAEYDGEEWYLKNIQSVRDDQVVTNLGQYPDFEFTLKNDLIIKTAPFGKENKIVRRLLNTETNNYEEDKLLIGDPNMVAWTLSDNFIYYSSTDSNNSLLYRVNLRNLERESLGVFSDRFIPERGQISVSKDDKLLFFVTEKELGKDLFYVESVVANGTN